MSEEKQEIELDCVGAWFYRPSFNFPAFSQKEFPALVFKDDELFIHLFNKKPSPNEVIIQINVYTVTSHIGITDSYIKGMVAKGTLSRVSKLTKVNVKCP